MGNPLVDQGVLNKIRGSVSWPDLPTLNVTAPYLGKDGIKLSLEGESTVYLPQMTGAVPSPEPYMMISLTIQLIKTQPISDLYKKRMEQNTLLGAGVVRPDVSSGLSPYPLQNCSIESVREMSFAGDDAGFVVVCKGYYLINSDLFN